jgi:hypothetical protein
MYKISELDEPLEEFRAVVIRLLESPTLETALDANLASLRLRELFHETETEQGGIPANAAERYSGYAHFCIAKFQEMIPRLNGDARHVDLYSEQMRGRKILVRQMTQY